MKFVSSDARRSSALSRAQHGARFALLSLPGTKKGERTWPPQGNPTLLDLVQVVSEYARSEDEIVATVTYLINSGKVLLCGNFAGARIDLATLADTASRGARRRASGPALSATQHASVYVFPV